MQDVFLNITKIYGNIKSTLIPERMNFIGPTQCHAFDPESKELEWVSRDPSRKESHVHELALLLRATPLGPEAYEPRPEIFPLWNSEYLNVRTGMEAEN